MPNDLSHCFPYRDKVVLHPHFSSSHNCRGATTRRGTSALHRACVGGGRLLPMASNLASRYTLPTADARAFLGVAAVKGVPCVATVVQQTIAGSATLVVDISGGRPLCSRLQEKVRPTNLEWHPCGTVCLEISLLSRFPLRCNSCLQ